MACSRAPEPSRRIRTHTGYRHRLRATLGYRGLVGRSKIAAHTGEAAVRAVLARLTAADAGADTSIAVPSETTALAVRYLLQELAAATPGNTLEVRVPPFGAVQCVEGPNHSRGTPPNVIEMDAETWVELATGSLEWSAALSAHRVAASGTRANLEGLLPVGGNGREWLT